MAVESCREYVRGLAPYIVKNFPSLSADAGSARDVNNNFRQRVNAFLDRGCLSTLEVKYEDGTRTTLKQHLRAETDRPLQKVVLRDGPDDLYAETAALVSLRVTTAAVLLAEAVEYIREQSLQGVCNATFLGSLCSRLEKVICVNDEGCFQENRSIGSGMCIVDSRTGASFDSTVWRREHTLSTPRRTNAKQMVASEKSLLDSLSKIRAQEATCFLATEVLRGVEHADEEHAKAAVLLSIRFLVVGAEIAAKVYHENQHMTSERLSHARHFCSQCVIVGGRIVGLMSSKYATVNLENWLVAAEDFCETFGAGVGNVRVSLFCGMIGSLVKYSLSEPEVQSCKRALLMCLRLLEPAQHTYCWERKGGRSATLQSPELVATKLITSVRDEVSLEDLTDLANELLPHALVLSRVVEPPSILSHNAPLDIIFTVCGRFLLQDECSSESAWAALLQLFSTVMSRGATYALASVEWRGNVGEREPAEGISTVAELRGKADEKADGSSNIAQANVFGIPDLEIVNLSAQVLLVLVDFVPNGKSVWTSVSDFYSACMETARALPLEALHFSVASILSSGLRSLLLSAPHDQNDSQLMRMCRTSVMDAFIEPGSGGFRDPDGLRQEAFFFAFIALKSERYRYQADRDEPIFVSRLIAAFLNDLERVLLDRERRALPYAAILLVTYTFTGLLSYEQRAEAVRLLCSSIERSVKSLSERQESGMQLDAILLVLSLYDFCVEHVNVDDVPDYLDKEIESEVFCPFVRGQSGSIRFYQLGRSWRTTSTLDASKLRNDFGLTCGCIELLLDTVCAAIWDHSIGNNFDIGFDEMYDFIDAGWHVLERLDDGTTRSPGESGLTAELNALRKGVCDFDRGQIERCANSLREMPLKVSTCARTIGFCSSYIDKLVNDGTAMNESTMSLKLCHSILDVVDNLCETWAGALYKQDSCPQLTMLTPRAVIASIYTSASGNCGLELLRCAAIALVDASAEVARRLYDDGTLVWKYASISSQMPPTSDLHRRMMTAARAAYFQDGRGGAPEDLLHTVFVAHRIATIAISAKQSSTKMEAFLSFLKESIGSTAESTINTLAVRLVFGGTRDCEFSNLIPQSSLVEPLCAAVRRADNDDAAELLQLYVALAEVQGEAWRLSVEQAVKCLLADTDSFMAMCESFLESTRTGPQFILLFERYCVAEEQNVNAAMERLFTRLRRHDTSIVYFQQACNLRLAICASMETETQLERLLHSHCDTVAAFWDEELLRSNVLNAEMKSCILMDRVVKICTAIRKITALRSDGDDTSLQETANVAQSKPAEPEIADIGLSDEQPVEVETKLPSDLEADADDKYAPDKLLSMTCTFTETGRQFVEQHWYYCYTCGMTWGEGVCGVCAMVCHKDHDVSYSRLSRFFCDCGASDIARRRGGEEVSHCYALRPRQAPAQPAETKEGQISPDASSSLGTSLSASPTEASAEGSELRCETDEAFDRRLNSALDNLSSESLRKINSGMMLDKKLQCLLLGARGALQFGEDRLYSAGIRELRMRCHDQEVCEDRTDLLRFVMHTRASAVTLKKNEGHQESQHLLTRKYLTYNNDGLIVIGDPCGKVSVVEADQLLIRRDGVIDKSAIKYLSTMDVPFNIGYVDFSPEDPRCFVYSGDDRAFLVRLSNRGDQLRSFAMELGLIEEADQQRPARENHVRSLSWIEGHSGMLAVVADQFVKLYNIEEDIVAPQFYLPLSLLNDAGESAFCRAAFGFEVGRDVDALADRYDGRIFAMLTTTTNQLYIAELSDQAGPFVKQVHSPAPANVVSLVYSRWMGSFVCGLDDGSLLSCKLDGINNVVLWMVHKLGVGYDVEAPGMLLESPDAPDTLMHLTPRRAAPSTRVIRMLDGRLQYQPLRGLTESLARVLGGCFCTASNRANPKVPFALLLLEDGSLHGFELLSAGGLPFPPKPTSREGVTAQHSELLDPHDFIPHTVGFFEKCREISGQITLGGDVLQCNGGISTARVRATLWGPLADCLVAPTGNRPLNILVSCSNRRLVIVGVRLLVGGCERSKSRVPSEISVFGRTGATLNPGLRRWVDIPFKATESQSSPRECTIELKPPRDAASDGCCAFDALDVYAMTTAEFARWQKTYAAKKARIKEESAKRDRQETRRRKHEELARSSELAHRKSMAEETAVAMLQLIELERGAVAPVQCLYSELNNLTGRAPRALAKCQELLRYHIGSNEMHRSLNIATIKQARSAATRYVELNVYAPREVEALIGKVGQALSGQGEILNVSGCFDDASDFCSHIFVLFLRLGRLGRQSLVCQEEATVRLLNVFLRVCQSRPLAEHDRVLLIMLSSLLTAKDGDIRAPVSDRLVSFMMELVHDGDASAVEEEPNYRENLALFFHLLNEILKRINIYSDARRPLGLRICDALNLLRVLAADEIVAAHVITTVLRRDTLSSRINTLLQKGNPYSEDNVVNVMEALLLLRFVATICELGTPSKDVLGGVLDTDLVCVISTLLDVCRQRAEELTGFYASSSGCDTGRDTDADLLYVPGLTTSRRLEPLLSAQALESIESCSTNGNARSLLLCVMTMENALDALRQLFIISPRLHSDAPSKLQEDICAIALLYKNCSRDSSTHDTPRLKSSSMLAKSILKLLFGDCSQEYYSKLDEFLFTQHMSFLRMALNEAFRGGSIQALSYENQVRVLEGLSRMLRSAYKRPWNWRTFSSQGRSIDGKTPLDLLFGIACSHTGPLQLHAMHLLGAAFSASTAEASRFLREVMPTMSKAVKEVPSTEVLVSCAEWKVDGYERVRELLERFVLRSQDAAVRRAAAQVIRGLYWTARAGEPTLYAKLQELILLCLPFATTRGPQGAQLFDLLADVAQGKDARDEDFSRTIARNLCERFRDALSFASSHESMHIYRALSRLTALDRFFLETNVCVPCASLTETTGAGETMKRLDRLRAESRYTDRAILCRLNGQQSISSISCKMMHAGRFPRLKTINIWYSWRIVSETTELKSPSHPWRPAKSLSLKLRQSEASVSFPIPIVACNLMFELAELHTTDLDGNRVSERLSCPRCSRAVTDRHGICRNCHENAYQCRQCRNINYENLDAYLCNECGHCKHGRFDFMVQSTPSHAFERVDCEADRKRAMEAVEVEMSETLCLQALLRTKREKMATLLNDNINSRMRESTPASEQRSVPTSPAEESQGASTESASMDSPSIRDSPLTALLTRLAQSEQGNDGDDGELATVRVALASDSTARSAPLSGAVVIDGSGDASASTNRAFTGSHGAGATPSNSAAQPLLPGQSTGVVTFYTTECREVFMSMCTVLQDMTAKRLELLRYTGEPMFSITQTNGNFRLRCFNCAVMYVRTCANLLSKLLAHPTTRDVLVQCKLMGLLLGSSDIIAFCAGSKSKVQRLISALAPLSDDSRESLINHVSSKINLFVQTEQMMESIPAIEGELQVIEDLLLGGDTATMASIQNLLVRVFVEATESSSSSVAEHVVLPFLRMLANVAAASENGPYRAEMVLGRDIDCQNMLMQTVLRSPSLAVRQEAVKLLRLLAPQRNAEQARAMIDYLLWDGLSTVSAMSGEREQYFDLFEWLLVQRMEEHGSYITSLQQCLARNILQKAAKLQEAENDVSFVDFNDCYVLKRLIALLRCALSSAGTPADNPPDRATLISPLLRAYLSLSKLIVQRTQLTEECASELLHLLSGDVLLKGKADILRAFIEELATAHASSDTRGLTVLLEQLCELLCPARPEPEYSLILSKAPTQEDFIRGSLSDRTYTSSSIGKSMRDIKNKICRDLELTGMLDDSFGLELLVHNSLIHLDLPIQSVYEHVWKPATEGSTAEVLSAAPSAARAVAGERAPMIVVYRLSGLDGEATEARVDTLPEIAVEEIDPEEEFALTAMFGELNGLVVLLDILSSFSDWSKQSQAVTTPALRLLRSSSRVRANRLRLCARPALSTLFECSVNVLRTANDGRADTAETLLLTLESVLQQQHASNADADSNQDALPESHVVALLKGFLDALSCSVDSPLDAVVLRLLPFICFRRARAREELLKWFTYRLDIFTLDTDADNRIKCHLLTQMLQSPAASLDEQIQRRCAELGLLGQLVDFVTDRFPYPRQEHMEHWQASMDTEGVSLALALLHGLLRHLASSSEDYRSTATRCLSPLLPTLTTLETVTSTSSLGNVAEFVLEDLGALPDFAAQIDALRKHIKEARRKAAMARRAAMMLENASAASTILDAGGPALEVSGRSSSNDAALEAEDTWEDESGPVCVVCREGYRERPQEVLCLYVYNWRCTAQQHSNAGLLSGSGVVYSTLTAFNAVHLVCHREAVRVDRTMRQARDEWEGSTLRNQQTRCNNIFPLRPPQSLPSEADACSPSHARSSTPASSTSAVLWRSYTDAIEQYFLRIHVLGGCNLNHAQLLIYDMSLSLLRFGKGLRSVFAEETRGGGAHSNASFIPCLWQLALQILEDDSTEADSQLSALESYLSLSDEGEGAYFLASALVAQPLAFWRQHCGQLLRGMLREQETRSSAMGTVLFAHVLQTQLKGELDDDSPDKWRAQMQRMLVQDVQNVNVRVLETVKMYEQHVHADMTPEQFLEAVASCHEIAAERQHFVSTFSAVLQSST